MVTVSFPGLGIEPFSFNKVAFTIPLFGGVQVRWYGIIIVTGIILAFIYAWWRGKSEGVSLDDLLDIAIYTVLAGMVGARLYYVLTSLDQYDSVWEMFAIWNGGIAIYGGLIGGSIAILVVCRVKKLKWQKVFDTVAPGVMIGQILGRWGNFFNGEAFGETPAEGSPLYFLRMGLQHENWSREYFYQPTFLYESLWNLLGFIIINIFYNCKKKFDGQIFLMYITWYGLGRMFIEGLRTDSLYVGVFRISQVVAFICFVLGTVLLIVFSVRAKRAVLAEGDYDSVYGKVLRERDSKSRKPGMTDDGAENGNGAGTDGAGEEKPETEVSVNEAAETDGNVENGEVAGENGNENGNNENDGSDH